MWQQGQPLSRQGGWGKIFDAFLYLSCHLAILIGHSIWCVVMAGQIQQTSVDFQPHHIDFNSALYLFYTALHWTIFSQENSQQKSKQNSQQKIK